MIRVVVAEDQSMVLGALAALLDIEPEIEVVGQARDGREALELVEQHRPDVLLTDIEMPLMTGLEVAAEVAKRRLATRVIILTTFARGGYLRRALDAGGRAIDSELAREAWTERDPLNDRERQVLRMAAEGTATASIAASLGLSEGTVRNYLSDAISKLGASNRVEAARTAREKGWL